MLGRVLLDGPEAHARVLHPADAPGRVTLAIRNGGRWLEFSCPVSDLAYTVRSLAGQTDVYLSQNRFWSKYRRIAWLAQLDALYVDLDYYRRPELQHLRPWHVLDLALEALEDQHLPVPSFAVSSGQGLALVWLHSPVPRAALPRWNACQRRLYEVLAHLGADPRARDAARVLRLVGTVHGKTGALVEALTPAAPPWPFDRLADEILPLTRAELYDLRVRRALRRARQQEAQVRPPEGFTVATLWEARLSDLQRLLDLRFWRPLPPGHRDVWLFIATVAMSWLAIPQVLVREAFALAREVGGWDEREARSRLQAVLSRAFAAARGERVEWMGQQVDPRYRMRTETILEWLEITPEEQRHLQVLVGPEIARERERQRWHERQKAAGRGTGLSREEYLAQARAEAEERRKEARRLAAEGKSQKEIAELLGVDRRTVWRWLKA